MLTIVAVRVLEAVPDFRHGLCSIGVFGATKLTPELPEPELLHRFTVFSDYNRNCWVLSLVIVVCV